MEELGNVLITGATGYIGSKLSKYLLESGYKVSVIVRPDSSLENLKDIQGNIDFFTYDGSYKSLEMVFESRKYVAAFHLASLSTFSCSGKDIPLMINSNITFLAQLLEAMSNYNCPLLINTSTYSQFDKDGSYLPINLYAATKQAAEDIIEFYCLSRGISSISLRLYDVYGTGDKREKFLTLLNKAHANNETLDMTQGQQKIIMLYIDDVVRAYHVACELLKNDDSYRHKHTKYFLPAEKNTLKDIVEKYAAVSQKQIKINWGKLDYRPNQIMDPAFEEGLPNWKVQVSLEEGMKKVACE